MMEHWPYDNTPVEELLLARALEEVVSTKSSIVIYNDDFHTFDFVIETLVEVCGHEPMQAEQCTYIIHHVGKCAVRTGVFKKLQPMWSELTQRGLTATIEDVSISA